MVDQGRTDQLSRLIKSGICTAEDAKAYETQLKQLAEAAANAEEAKNLSRFFRALADKSRIRLLRLLEVREMCVCELMVALSMTQPTTSHHLGLLENAGLVRSRKEGKWVFYRIADQRLLDNMHKVGVL